MADGAGGGTRTPTTLQPPGPKPGASTNSATPARPASCSQRAEAPCIRSAGMAVKQSGGAMERNRMRSAADTARRSRPLDVGPRSEEHTSELQSLMRHSYAVFCLTKKTTNIYNKHRTL